VSDGRLKNSYGIYIHYPFCKRLCFYCHFIKRKFEPDLSSRYIDYLLKEIELKRDENKLINTIYFGGGSPGLIEQQDIYRIIEKIDNSFNLYENAEITIELNPDDVEFEDLKFLKKTGLNRLSVGIQSLSAEDLNYLKRTHSVNRSISVLEDVKKAGFDNINADFIIGLPTQTEESLLSGFSRIDDLGIPHLSVYILEGVKEKNEKEDVFDEFAYFKSQEILKELGYTRYEVSNCGKRSFQSIHNNKYWNNEPYIAFGLSASGYEDGVDYKNTVRLNEYFELIDDNKLPIAERQRMNTVERRIITGLRTTRGVLKEYFSDYETVLNMLLKEKILQENDGRISIVSEKILLLNEILTYFKS